MNDTQTRKLNMGAAVLGGLNDNDSIISGNAAAEAKRTQLEANIETIEQADEDQQASSSGGEAITKEEAKHNMADQADVIAQALCAFALDSNNHVLYEQMNKHAPAIIALKDADAIAFCNLVAVNANTNILALAPYNITAGMVTALNTSIEAFGSNEAAPRNAQGEHHTATTNVSAGIVAMLKTLLWWDHFVATYRNTNHDFYTDYHTWRKLVNTGIRHISIRGIVKDSLTGTPLYKVKVTMAGNTAAVLSGKTGKFRIFSLTPGVYTLNFFLPGYQTLTIPNVSVLEGKITDLPVNLVKL